MKYVIILEAYSVSFVFFFFSFEFLNLVLGHIVILLEVFSVHPNH